MKIIMILILLTLLNSPLASAASEIRKLEQFTSINLAMAAEVYYRVSSKPHLKITAPQALFPLITTDIKQGQLVIKAKGNFKDKVVIEAYSSTLTAAVVASSGSIYIRDIKVDTANFIMAGAGLLKVSGEASEVLVNLTGSGDVDIEKLDTKKLQIDLFGSGNIKAAATDYAHLHNMGSGNIQMRGEPAQRKIEKHATGEIIFIQ